MGGLWRFLKGLWKALTQTEEERKKEEEEQKKAPKIVINITIINGMSLQPTNTKGLEPDLGDDIEKSLEISRGINENHNAKRSQDEFQGPKPVNQMEKGMVAAKDKPNAQAAMCHAIGNLMLVSQDARETFGGGKSEFAAYATKALGEAKGPQEQTNILHGLNAAGFAKENDPLSNDTRKKMGEVATGLADSPEKLENLSDDQKATVAGSLKIAQLEPTQQNFDLLRGLEASIEGKGEQQDYTKKAIQDEMGKMLEKNPELDRGDKGAAVEKGRNSKQNQPLPPRPDQPGSQPDNQPIYDMGNNEESDNPKNDPKNPIYDIASQETEELYEGLDDVVGRMQPKGNNQTEYALASQKEEQNQTYDNVVSGTELKNGLEDDGLGEDMGKRNVKGPWTEGVLKKEQEQEQRQKQQEEKKDEGVDVDSKLGQEDTWLNEVSNEDSAGPNKSGRGA